SQAGMLQNAALEPPCLRGCVAPQAAPPDSGGEFAHLKIYSRLRKPMAANNFRVRYIIPIVCCLCVLSSASAAQRDAADRWSKQYDDASRALEQGRYSEAAALFLDAVQQAEKLGMNNVRLAESLNGLAQVYRYQQDYAAAEPLARR